MAQNNIEIRMIRSEDYEAVVEVDEKVYGSKRPGFFRRKIEQTLSREDYLITSRVAIIDGRLVGFIMGELYLGEFGIPEKTAIIDAVAVHPDYQKRGVGRALMEELLPALKKAGVEKVSTLVEWDDWRMLSFFRTYGFKPGTALNLIRTI